MSIMLKMYSSRLFGRDASAATAIFTRERGAGSLGATTTASGSRRE